ncbi:alanine racemase [Salinimicrobium sp. TH3]|uniref:alanine racemase n=1 Tax=Salinimicrobium sp. TH3 TaxID=2997342 RepID=UPI0022766A84|nr:alanine racemase [Salinimicrobium sp. TH3]MCY2688520.1 alanine racemase [Salinimicrobium sp. TH3]
MFKITKPTLLLDRNICIANIGKMANKALKHNVELIPHFKTHQSAQVGEWFKEAGVRAITVTSVKMAKYFAQHGWKDITIAFPVNVLEINKINELAKLVDLKIFVNSKETAAILKQQLRTPVKFYIEIDVGDGRSGVNAEDFSAIAKILEVTKDSVLEFLGFYTHAGHTYNAVSPKEVEAIFGEVLEKLRSVKRHFRKIYPNLKLALGDTPSCSIMENFIEIDSIHPGNFVFYDLVQHGIGANTFEEIAICLAVPMVAVHPERQEVVVYSGWVHQGKDSLLDVDGNNYYGVVVNLEGEKWTAPIPNAKVIKVSQEHGVIDLPSKVIDGLKIGDVLGILPVHACATAVMMGEFWTLEGERLGMMPK